MVCLWSVCGLSVVCLCGQERYTCPSLALHPVEEGFVAQTNGNYMALFSGLRPYRMNKRRRYEGHKVSLVTCRA